jgi:hypothetical protein
LPSPDGSAVRKFHATPLNPPQPHASNLPPDDPARRVVVANADDGPDRKHIAVAGDTYTILLTGHDTAGRFCLIDMLVRPAVGRRPIAMTSKKCLPFSKAKSSSPFAVKT